MSTKKIPSRLAASWLTLLSATAIIAACDDPTGLRPTVPTSTSVMTAFAINGTTSELPSALSLPANQMVRPDANLLFDVVFDIDSQGRVVLYPIELMVWPRIDAHPVGLLKSDQSFASLTRAPSGGYDFANPLVAQVGDVIVVESHDSRVCGFPFSPRLYAKLSVESVDIPTRSIRVRVTQNANCGSRSFLAGIPTD